jgi:hypothetical protein
MLRDPEVQGSNLGPETVYSDFIRLFHNRTKDILAEIFVVFFTPTR